MADEVLTEVSDGVAVITINRPQARNAVNGAVARGIGTAVAELDARTGRRSRRTHYAKPCRASRSCAASAGSRFCGPSTCRLRSCITALVKSGLRRSRAGASAGFAASAAARTTGATE